MIEPTKNRTFKLLLLFIVFVVMLLPIIQSKYQFIDSKELGGAFTTYEKPSFSFSSWFTGDYQEQMEKYHNQNFGFRNTLVRAHNQFQYDVFDYGTANHTIVGKDHFLYDENYIYAYLGRDFVGLNSIEKKVHQLSYLQNKLQEDGIQLITCFAPGKASYFPEYIPDSYHPTQKDSSNYEVYRDLFLQNNIQFLNLHQWFTSIKDTSTYPLFPKNGIHWSSYAEYLVSDTILDYLSAIQNSEMPRIQLNHIVLSDSMMERDQDIEDGMNLWNNLEDFRMAYPNYTIKINDSISTCRVLVIADSYYWGLHSKGMTHRAFNDGEFWYYNHEIHPNSTDGTTNLVDSVYLPSRIQQFDAILLLATEASLKTFAFDFIDRMYEVYSVEDSTQKANPLFEEQIQNNITAIEKDHQWMNSIRRDAHKKNITMERAIRDNAIFVIRNIQGN